MMETATTQNAFICVGIISSAHGVRGAVKIKSFTSNPEDFNSYGDLQDEAGKRTFRIKVISATKETFLVSVDGVSDRNAAEALRGTKLFVPRVALAQTDPDEFYHADLIGMAATTPSGKEIGTVTSVQNYGASDILEIAMGDGSSELLVFSKMNVPEVDVAGRRMTVVFPKSVTVKQMESAE